ncbi:putative protein YneK, partial [Escherichia coli]
MVTPVSISNYISLPDDFPVRNIAPKIKEVLKDFIDALREGANKRGNSSRLTQSFHFFMFEPIFSPVNA